MASSSNFPAPLPKTYNDLLQKIRRDIANDQNTRMTINRSLAALRRQRIENNRMINEANNSPDTEPYIVYYLEESNTQLDAIENKLNRILHLVDEKIEFGIFFKEDVEEISQA